MHTHSNCSDGCDPVPRNYEAAMAAGLDFIFATDHASLRQKRFLPGLPRADWGQEPGCGGHHVGLLRNRRLFKPRGDFPRDFQAARRLAEFVWVPHPVGWYPRQRYGDDRISQLWSIGDAFAMEIINGAGKIFRAYDEWDAKACLIWDRLLADGRRVTALAGSDAHISEALGMVWTGVYAGACRAPSIIKALQAGSCFASEAPLLELQVNDQPMGSEVLCAPGAPIKLRFRAADACGIAWVRIIRDQRIVRSFPGRGRTLTEGGLTWRAPRRPGYVRVEVGAVDDLRAFSSPAYILPA
ncbi:MAG: CehA/McbA family metallohydrolase [Lentisphaerae bacterium]|nr:CehA/McbA family metallohydrolase [Lentisphaerota bacterium]